MKENHSVLAFHEAHHGQLFHFDHYRHNNSGWRRAHWQLHGFRNVGEAESRCC
jgi:hypothetical protein